MTFHITEGQRISRKREEFSYITPRQMNVLQSPLENAEERRTEEKERKGRSCKQKGI
jgi:hypothetical protein